MKKRILLGVFFILIAYSNSILFALSSEGSKFFVNKKSFVIYIGMNELHSSDRSESLIFDEIHKSTGLVASYLPSAKRNLIVVNYNDQLDGCSYELGRYDPARFGRLAAKGDSYGIIHMPERGGGLDFDDKYICILEALVYFYGGSEKLLIANRSEQKSRRLGYLKCVFERKGEINCEE